MQQIEFEIRPAASGDLEAVVEIELAAGLSSWGVAGYSRELGEPAAVLLVAVGGDIAGFISGRAAADEMEILSVAVRPEYRGRRIAATLLETLIADAVKLGTRRIFLEVRASNGAAIELYHKQGFEISGTRRGYYKEPSEDAIVMTLQF